MFHLNAAGYDDWRLPSATEFISIADYSTREPAVLSLFVNYLININSGFYWSSTTDSIDHDYAVRFSGAEGLLNATAKSGTWSIRCVRSTP
ncbi:DUF1566 domain-containing protein [Deferribacteres bacterium DY0037]|uniref:Lcl C-terminal domain-containing protein n=1 Tax=Denitrovibrio acetiphilus TaxID=118000 RepID=UPI0009FE504F